MQLDLPRPVRRALTLVGRTATRVAKRRAWRAGPIAAPTTRARFLSQIDGDVLEIGPFDGPALRGPNVAYFDVLDQAGLSARAREHGHNPDTCPEIDYVSPFGDLAVVDRQFDAVFSSHVIEHQPDLIAHLNGVERILKPGGRYFLIVPDKRFCFDHFTADSGIDDAVAAHTARRAVHSADAIRLHWLQLTHNDALRHWLGLHGKPGSFNHSPDKAVTDAARAEAGEYVDVHGWRFTPGGFQTIFERLTQRGLTRLRPVRVHDTMFGQMEFFAVLER